MGSHLKFEQWVPFSLEQVLLSSRILKIYAHYARSRRNKTDLVPRIPPPEVTEWNCQGPGCGSGLHDRNVISRDPFLAVRQHWIARITEFEWNHTSPMCSIRSVPRWHHRHDSGQRFAMELRDTRPGTRLNTKSASELSVDATQGSCAGTAGYFCAAATSAVETADLD